MIITRKQIIKLFKQIKDWEAKSKNQDTIHKTVLQKKKKEIENSAYLYKRCLGLEHKIFEMEVSKFRPSRKINSVSRFIIFIVIRTRWHLSHNRIFHFP